MKTGERDIKRLCALVIVASACALASATVVVPALVSGSGPVGQETLIPRWLRGQRTPPALPKVIRQSAFADFWRPRPLAAKAVGEIAGGRYWAIRGNNNYLCLVGARRLGVSGTCSPAASLRLGAITTGIRAADGHQLIGLARDGYTTVAAEGSRYPITRNVFRLTLRQRHTSFQLMGAGMNTLTLPSVGKY